MRSNISPAYRVRRCIGLTVALATAPHTAHAAPPEPSQHLVAYGADRFAYGAGWERTTGHDDGRYLGSSLRSFHPGARATLDFEGTAVRVYGVLGLGGGIGIITIDGKLADVMSFFAARKVTHRAVYASPTLRRGLHHMTIEVVRPSRDPKAKPGFVNIDSAEVTP